LLQDWEARAPDAKGVLSLRKQKQDYIDKMGITQKSQDLLGQAQSLAIQKNQLKLQGIEAERRILEKNYQSGVIKDPAEYNARSNDLDRRAQALANEPLPVPSWTEPPSNAPKGDRTETAPKTSDAGIPTTGVEDKSAKSSKSIDKNAPELDQTNTRGPKKNLLGAKNPQLTPDANVPTYQHVVKAPAPSGETTAVYEQKKATAANTAKVEEDRATKAMDPYYMSINPRVASSYDSALDDLRLIQKDPELQKGYATLHNLLRKEGGPLAVAAQKGLSANLGGYGASFSIPTADYIAAGVDPKYWGLYDRIISNYNTIASVHAMLDGKSLDDFKKNPDMWTRYAHIGKTADDAYRTVNENMFDFKMHQAIGRELPKIRARIQAEHPDELAPNAAALQDKAVQEIMEQYRKAREVERKIHRAATQPQNKPKP
jgi:hypothetical protein